MLAKKNNNCKKGSFKEYNDKKMANIVSTYYHLSWISFSKYNRNRFILKGFYKNDMFFPLKSPSEYVEIIFLSKVQIQPYMDMIFPFDFEAVFITSTVLVGIQT